VLIVAAIALAPVAAWIPVQVLMMAPVAIGLILLGYARPPWAAYLLLALTPLTAGISRGVSVPVLRPHEALGLLLGIGVALRALTRARSGHRLRLRLARIDVAILAMAVAGSVLPLLWMAARGMSPTTEDLLYAAKIWKFYGLFLVVRASVHTERQVKRCLQVSIAAYAVVAVVALLQSLQLGGVPHLLSLVYGTDESLAPRAGRGTATLGSSIAVGDAMAFHLAICGAWLLRGGRPRPLLAGLAVLFAVGGLGSGQFSGLIALGVVVVTITALTGHIRRLLLSAVPLTLVSAAVLLPVVQARVDQLDISTGLPQSWLVRYDNLRLFVWPQVFSKQNWLFGVRPSSRIAADVIWGPYIFIESGHLWLLWAGGIPLLLAFLYFTWAGVRATAAIARSRRGPVGVAASASLASLLAMFVLMTFDPHITLRGTADLLFSLLALATAVRAGDPAYPRRVRMPRPAPSRGTTPAVEPSVSSRAAVRGDEQR
jgi:hypothetical protein